MALLNSELHPGSGGKEWFRVRGPRGSGGRSRKDGRDTSESVDSMATSLEDSRYSINKLAKSHQSKGKQARLRAVSNYCRPLKFGPGQNGFCIPQFGNPRIAIRRERWD